MRLGRNPTETELDTALRTDEQFTTDVTVDQIKDIFSNGEEVRGTDLYCSILSNFFAAHSRLGHAVCRL